MPADVYLTTGSYEGRLWIPAIGLAWSPQEEYHAGILTGATHFTFAPKMQELNGNQQALFRMYGGVQIGKDIAKALIEGAFDFSHFRPRYSEVIRRSVISIVDNITF